MKVCKEQHPQPWKIKHGRYHHRLYRVWSQMIARVYNPNDKGFINYGERGITVCDRWHDIENFIEDMDTSFSKGLSIERRNNHKNYNKSNCYWADNATQSQNRRKFKSNKSGYIGVWYDKEWKRYVVWISVRKERIFIGRFKEAIDAAFSRDKYIRDNGLLHTKNLTEEEFTSLLV